MKFLSSSSSSASSTTTTTTTTSTSTSCNGNKWWLAGMLRQLLCFNSLPTHPSDQFKDTELNSVEVEKHGCFETEEANPGIVARLMGLESLAPINSAHTHMGRNSITRSRSMSYDSYREKESIQGGHRRVETSFSFREMPTFVELENEEFLVLSFENRGENTEFRSKSKRSEAGSGKLRRRKAQRCKHKYGRTEEAPEEKENQEPNKEVRTNVSNCKAKDLSSQILLPTNNCNHTSNGGKQEEVEEEDRVPETECNNSENSSPVSVLELGESIIDLDISTSEVDARLAGSNSRRKLSADLENYDHSSPSPSPSPSNHSSSSTSDVQERKLVDGKCQRLWKDDYEMWGEICEMAEDAVTESNWAYRELWKLEDFGGICAGFELQILENLLSELVGDQLVETGH